MQRMTISCPNNKSYRSHLNSSNTIRIEGASGTDVFGSIIDRLGEYESLELEPDEIFNLLKKSGDLPQKAIDNRNSRNVNTWQ